MSKKDASDLVPRFANLSSDKKLLDRAVRAVVEGCVKRHEFMPSGRVIHTVVGKAGEEFIDPDRPFCSCKNFFFRVLGGQSDTCYHLLSYKIARESQLFDTVTFDDEEFRTFLGLLTLDLLKDKEDKDS